MDRLYKMQIFPKLQRNSVIKIFIKGVFYFVLSLFNSGSLFAPWFMGWVFCFESIEFGMFYIALFSVFHNLSFFITLYLIVVFVVFKEILYHKTLYLVSEKHKDDLAVVISYLFFLPLVTNKSGLIIIVYNIFLDIIFINLYKLLFKKTKRKKEISEN